MNEALLYLLKMAACSGLFYLYYLVALRNRLFHQWNRFYLLLAVGFSMAIPLLRWNISGASDNASAPAIRLLQVVGSAGDYLEEVTVYSHRALSTADWMMIGYAGVTVVLLVLFFRSLLRIRLLVRTHAIQLLQKIRFINTRIPGTPFSFFNYIFWNEEIDLQSTTGQQIFQHELVHVEEKHSWDRLFLQLVLIVFWCNPFFWLMRRELKQIHEFIADRRSVGQHGAPALAAMILQSAYPNQYSQLTHSFFQTPVKRRILMLTKIQNPRLRYFGRLLALPVFAFAILAFTVKMRPAFTHTIRLEKPITVVIDAGHGQVNSKYNGARSGNVYEDDIVLQLAHQIEALNSNPNVHIILTRSDDQSVDLKQRVAIAASNKADLFLSLHMNFAPEGSNANSDVVRTSGMEIFVPKDATPYQAQSELFGSALQQELQGVYKTYPGLLKHTGHIWVLDNNVVPSVLVECGYLSDAKDRSFLVKESNQKLVAQKILNAIQEYASQRDHASTMTDTVPSGKPQPLYVVDGKINGRSPGEINPNTIQSINVLKGKTATDKYGEQGKDGVVEVTLKKELSTQEDTSMVLMKTEVDSHIDNDTWKQFLQDNLQQVISNVGRKAPAGNYNVFLRFVVEKDGRVDDVSVLNDPGYGIGDQLRQMMTRSPRWTAAMQNGHPVRAYHTQPISMVITN